MKQIILNTIFLLTLLLSVESRASNLAATLKDFNANTVVFMNSIPPKRFPMKVKPFRVPAIESLSFVAEKNLIRKAIGRSTILDNDLPENLVDNSSSMIKTLETMEERHLNSASLEENPWSDFYWPIYEGELAFRYADSNFPGTDNWKENSDYVLNGANFSSVDTLSPAEKYDLLVGDREKTLTHYSVNEGAQYYANSGRVETWMGICHGWAPASYMLNRPTHNIRVMAADGRTKITFYPSDIKALASLLWANNAGNTKFVGGRCDLKQPREDRNGRVIDQDCFDSNPGTWHMAVVNQIGVSKRSFVIDATYDYEVWNQPMLSYSYSYFNPQTLSPTNSIAEASVAIEEFTNDKFSKYRSAKTKKVVGVNMRITYVVETYPSTRNSDTPQDDALNEVEYQYDLEIDTNGAIIGGEWYRNTHPDFLWTPSLGAKAMTPSDEFLVRNGLHTIPWTGSTAFPKEWIEPAIRASASSPLSTVVEALIQISQAGL